MQVPEEELAHILAAQPQARVAWQVPPTDHRLQHLWRLKELDLPEAHGLSGIGQRVERGVWVSVPHCYEARNELPKVQLSNREGEEVHDEAERAAIHAAKAIVAEDLRAIIEGRLRAMEEAREHGRGSWAGSADGRRTIRITNHELQNESKRGFVILERDSRYDAIAVVAITVHNPTDRALSAGKSDYLSSGE